MSWYHELASSLGALFGRGRQEHEMDEELRFHIEMETKRNRDAGLSEDEARRRATRDFGGVERYKEDVRDERGTSWFYDGWRDVAFAARSLRRRAGFAAIATLTLALGLGATTTLFGVVKQVLLRPLPYGNPDRIAVVQQAGCIDPQLGDRDQRQPEIRREGRQVIHELRVVEITRGRKTIVGANAQRQRVRDVQ